MPTTSRRNCCEDVEHEGDIGAERFGYAAFKIGQVRNYLRAQAEGVAADLNRVTRENLAGAEVSEVFDRAKHERAPVAGMQLGTSAIARGNLEAARQSSDAARRTKTWIVTSGNSAHPEMDGETVALGASFSNGSRRTTRRPPRLSVHPRNQLGSHRASQNR